MKNMRTRIKAKFFINPLEYLLAFLLILECRSVFSVTTDFKLYFTYLSTFVIAILVILQCIILKKKFLKKSISVSIGLLIYIGFFVYFGRGATNTLFITRYLIFFPFLILYFGMLRGKMEDVNLLKCIVNIMVALAIISLFFWIFGSVLGVIKPNTSINYVWGGNKTSKGYYFLSYITQHYNFSEIGLPSFDIIRNTGIFTEAPMYNITLCIALLIEMFLFRKSKSKKAKILVITIISTFSTMGIFILISLFAVRWIINNSNSKIVRMMKLTIFPIIVIISISTIIYFFASKSSSISWRGHSGDFIAGFLAWKDKPLFGHGYGNYDALLNYYTGDLLKLRIVNNGFSNSITYLLAQCGLWMFLVYYIPLLAELFKQIKTRDINKFIFVGYIIALYSVVIVTYQNIIIMILAIFIVDLYLKGNLINEEKLEK